MACVIQLKETVRLKISSSDEWMLTGAIMLVLSGKLPSLSSSGVALARMVALQKRSGVPTCTHVDHANRDPTVDRHENIHWVTAQFNAFNVDKKPPASGYHGVVKRFKKYVVTHRSIEQGRFSDGQTGALVYNLVCRLSYGNMLLKVPDKLNKVPNEHSRVEKIIAQPDGINVYRVDQIFIVTYEGHVKNWYETHKEAVDFASQLVARLEDEKKQRDQQWEKQRAKLKVQRNAEGIAFFERTTKAGEKVQVLLDDEDWKDVKVQVFDLVLTRHNRIQIQPLGGGVEFLSRWLLRADLRTHVVDHISGDIYGHWRKNLRVVDASSNKQNARLPRRNESGYIGVYLLANKAYRASCFVKSKNRTVGRNFAAHELDKAIEIYDLVSLYQHGPGALVNRPEMLPHYLEMLELDETEQRIQAFLAPPKGATSQYQGVHLRSEKGGRFWYYKAVIKVQEVPSERGFSVDEAGSEVRAAIQYDLWRLGLLDRHMTVNFERMRPVYIHLLDHCTGYDAVEKAYECLGGDAFARAEAARIDQQADPQPAASGSSSNPISVDSPSFPPEAGPSSRPHVIPAKVVPAKRKS